MITFSLFNIPIRVLPWFWLTMALLSGQLFINSKEDLLLLLLFLIAGFISILVHELGHALTAKHFGKRVEIVLQAFGGYAAYSGGAPLSRPKTFLITAAGPAVQIILGIAVLVLLSLQASEKGISLVELMGKWGQSSPAVYFWVTLAWISFIWAILNLLPILPLDGGRLVESALGPGRRKVTLIISMVTGAVVCILSFTKFHQPFLGVFVGMFAYQSFKALQQPSWR